MPSWVKTFVVLFVLDSVYQSLTRSLFTGSSTSVLDQPNWVMALGVSAVVAFALQHFVLDQADTPNDAYREAAILGFAIYSSYHLANLAMVKEWPVKMSIVDTMWGTALLTTVAFIMF